MTVSEKIELQYAVIGFEESKRRTDAIRKAILDIPAYWQVNIAVNTKAATAKIEAIKRQIASISGRKAIPGKQYVEIPSPEIKTPPIAGKSFEELGILPSGKAEVEAWNKEFEKNYKRVSEKNLEVIQAERKRVNEILSRTGAPLPPPVEPETKETIDRVAKSQENLSRSVQQTTTRIKESKPPFDKATASVNSFGNAIKGTSANSISASRHFFQLAFSAHIIGIQVAIATSALAALSGVMIKTFAEFDKAYHSYLAKIDDMSKAISQARIWDLARDQVYGAADLAAVAERYAASGINVADSTSSMIAAARLAIIAEDDLAKTTQGLITILQAYGMNISEVSYLTDILVNAADASTAEVKDMTRWFGQAAAVSKVAGIEIEKLALLLGILSSTGIQEAGIYLRSLLKDVQQMKKARILAEAFSIEPDLIVGDFEKFIEAARKRLKEIPYEMRIPWLREIIIRSKLDQRAQVALISLLTAQDALITKIEGDLKKVGAAEEKYDIYTQSLSGTLEILNSNLQQISEIIGKSLVPVLNVLNDAVQFATGLFSQLSKVPFLTEAIGWSTALAAVAGSFGILYFFAKATIPVIVGWLIEGGIVSSELVDRFGALNAVMISQGLITKSQAAFGSKLLAIKNALGLATQFEIAQSREKYAWDLKNLFLSGKISTETYMMHLSQIKAAAEETELRKRRRPILEGDRLLAEKLTKSQLQEVISLEKLLKTQTEQARRNYVVTKSVTELEDKISSYREKAALASRANTNLKLSVIFTALAMGDLRLAISATVAKLIVWKAYLDSHLIIGLLRVRSILLAFKTAGIAAIIGGVMGAFTESPIIAVASSLIYLAYVASRTAKEIGISFKDIRKAIEEGITWAKEILLTGKYPTGLTTIEKIKGPLLPMEKKAYAWEVAGYPVEQIARARAEMEELLIKRPPPVSPVMPPKIPVGIKTPKGAEEIAAMVEKIRPEFAIPEREIMKGLPKPIPFLPKEFEAPKEWIEAITPPPKIEKPIIPIKPEEITKATEKVQRGLETALPEKRELLELAKVEPVKLPEEATTLLENFRKENIIFKEEQKRRKDIEDYYARAREARAENLSLQKIRELYSKEQLSSILAENKLTAREIEQIGDLWRKEKGTKLEALTNRLRTLETRKELGSTEAARLKEMIGLTTLEISKGEESIKAAIESAKLRHKEQLKIWEKAKRSESMRKYSLEERLRILATGLEAEKIFTKEEISRLVEQRKGVTLLKELQKKKGIEIAKRRRIEKGIIELISEPIPSPILLGVPPTKKIPPIKIPRRTLPIRALREKPPIEEIYFAAGLLPRPSLEAFRKNLALMNELFAKRLIGESRIFSFISSKWDALLASNFAKRIGMEKAVLFLREKLSSRIIPSNLGLMKELFARRLTGESRIFSFISSKWDALLTSNFAKRIGMEKAVLFLREKISSRIIRSNLATRILGENLIGAIRKRSAIESAAITGAADLGSIIAAKKIAGIQAAIAGFSLKGVINSLKAGGAAIIASFAAAIANIPNILAAISSGIAAIGTAIVTFAPYILVIIAAVAALAWVWKKMGERAKETTKLIKEYAYSTKDAANANKEINATIQDVIDLLRKQGLEERARYLERLKLSEEAKVAKKAEVDAIRVQEILQQREAVEASYQRAKSMAKSQEERLKLQKIYNEQVWSLELAMASVTRDLEGKKTGWTIEEIQERQRYMANVEEWSTSFWNRLYAGIFGKQAAFERWKRGLEKTKEVGVTIEGKTYKGKELEAKLLEMGFVPKEEERRGPELTAPSPGAVTYKSEIYLNMGAATMDYVRENITQSIKG